MKVYIGHNIDILNDKTHFDSYFSKENKNKATLNYIMFAKSFCNFFWFTGLLVHGISNTCVVSFLDCLAFFSKSCFLQAAWQVWNSSVFSWFWSFDAVRGQNDLSEYSWINILLMCITHLKHSKKFNDQIIIFSTFLLFLWKILFSGEK